jgi:hypothetical protein
MDILISQVAHYRLGKKDPIKMDMLKCGRVANWPVGTIKLTIANEHYICLI